jgi:hypothetical protein
MINNGWDLISVGTVSGTRYTVLFLKNFGNALIQARETRSLCKRQSCFELQGPLRLGKVVARKALEQGA